MHSEMVDIGQGMHVLQEQIHILTGKQCTLIIRKSDQQFWKHCIEVVHNGYRVAPIGNPGIGKTTSTALLIRLLFKQDKDCSVVYRMKGEGGYKVFTKTGSDFHINVVSESILPEDILLLLDSNNYYIVDPMGSQDSCNPSLAVKACVFLVTSPNDQHWGGSAFTKGGQNNIPMGVFAYYNPWSLEEALQARPYFWNKISEEDLVERFNEFGGIMRHLDAPTSALLTLQNQQTQGIDALSCKQVTNIVQGCVQVLDSANDKQPKSSVLCYVSTDFARHTCILISSVVGERIAVNYAELVWNAMLNAKHSTQAGYIFEPFLRNQMRSSKAYLCRRALLVSEVAQESDPREMILGGCEKIKQVVDPVLHVKDSAAGVLFHSSSDQHSLYDFIYKSQDEHGITYYAINATVGLNHTANAASILNLVKALDLKAHDSLLLIYAVPMERFQNFVLNPRNPSTADCNVRIVGIPRPSAESDASTPLTMSNFSQSSDATPPEFMQSDILH
jgi:hypothetical protein